MTDDLEEYFDWFFGFLGVIFSAIAIVFLFPVWILPYIGWRLWVKGKR